MTRVRSGRRWPTISALHEAIARATHNARLVELSLQVREASLGFGVEPYGAQVRGRALSQHPLRARAVIRGFPDAAAGHGAEHFTLTGDKLRELHRHVAGGTSTAYRPHVGELPAEA